MRTRAAILVALLFAVVVSAAQTGVLARRRAVPVVSAGVCADWKTNATALADAIADSTYSQRLTNDSGAGVVICEFQATLYNNSSGTCHVEVWTGPNATGTKLGDSSQSVSISDNGNPGWRVFTWSGVKPSVPVATEFFPVVVVDSGAVYARIVFAGDYTGTLYYGATGPVGAYSLGFSIRKEQ